jgi:hypothetical protein
LGQVNGNSALARPLGDSTGFNQADDKGFLIDAFNGTGVAILGGTWAYTAP